MHFVDPAVSRYKEKDVVNNKMLNVLLLVLKCYVRSFLKFGCRFFFRLIEKLYFKTLRDRAQNIAVMSWFTELHVECCSVC